MVSASRFKCDVTASGGKRLSQLFREKFIYSLALNISRNTRSVLPVFFDLVSGDRRHKTDVIGVEVHGVRS